MSTIRFELGNDGIALLSIEIPGKPINILTPDFETDLAAALDRIASDGAISGAIITSARDTGFIAGADLKELAQAYGRETAAECAARSVRMSGLFRRVERTAKPIACAINGLALGGGLELALACHYRILSDNPRAVLGLPEVKVGLLPGAGGTQRLPRLIGIARALPLMLGGDPVAPAQALALGMVHAVAPAGELVSLARAWVLANPRAQQPWDLPGFIMPGGAGCNAPHASESFQAGTSRLVRSTQRNYPAPLAIMSCVFEGTQVPIDVGLRIESKYFGTLLSGPVARNLMRTLFINKGAADSLSRRPAAAPKSKVARLGVLGAGMMGAGIAYVAAAAGVEVVLLDSTQEQADKGKAYSARVLQKELERGRSNAERNDTILSRIHPTADYSALAGCELVIEAVFERRDVKNDVTRRAGAAIGPQAILASNTSTLPITSLADAGPRPEQFIGLHFFSPVDRMPLVEVIRGRKTSDETLARALDFVAQLKKTPIVVNDSPGFFTSRVFGTFIDEGMAMLAEGVSPALIENAARMAGMPTGPLAITDEVTIDLQLKVHDQALADGLARPFQRLTAINVVKTMLKLGRPGRKDGAGFYEYPLEGRKRLWPGLTEIFPRADVQSDVEELRTRFLYIQALESARCMEEGVITSAAEGDIGSILGIGYPSWTGGTLSFIDTVGMASFVAECQRLARRHGARFRPSKKMLQQAKSGFTYHG